MCSERAHRSDVWNGAGPRNEEWRLPLAAELFRYRQQFWTILEGYKGASALQDELGPLSAGGGIASELKLREYAEHDDLRVRQCLRDVPLYIRDVVFTASRAYVQSPGVYSQLVKKMLLDYQYEVLFLTLNYD